MSHKYKDDVGRLFFMHAMLLKISLQIAPRSGDYTLGTGLAVTRRDQTTDTSEYGGRFPRMGIVVQGARYAEHNGMRMHSREKTCFVASGADHGTLAYAVPYVSLTLSLEPQLIQKLIMAGNPSFCQSSQRVDEPVAQADCGMMDAFLRLVKLEDRPDQVKHLAPLIVKEIHYRMLLSPLGENIRRISLQQTSLHNSSCNTDTNRIASWLFRHSWHR